MGDLSRPIPGDAGLAPTMQRSGERPKDETPYYVPGTTVAGRYKIDQPLGEGGMGRVYSGEHLTLGRKVAIKILLKKYVDQPAMVERFKTEARSASKICHPNVVPVYDYGTTDGGEAFLVMDLLEGDVLSDVIRQGPLELHRMLPILQQVALALRAAHAAGIVHRDLKPANVFLLRPGPNEPERVQVLDFGMAKLVELGKDGGGLTAAGEILGTPEYMAPEQAVGGGDIDKRTDVYAFGCLAFELWTGHPPFSGSNYVTVLAKQLDEKPPSLAATRDAPPGLESLVGRALAKNKDGRPKDMDEVLQRLAAIADEEGVPLYSSAPAAKPAPRVSGVRGPSTHGSAQTRQRIWFRRRMRRVLTYTALVAAGLTLGALGWRAFGPKPPPSGPSTLVLTTTPPGAQVSVDGKPLDEVTPTIARLSSGEHQVEASLPRYVTAKVKSQVGAGASEVVKIALQKDTYKLALTSDPAGAQVFLDGFVMGVTPVELDVDPLDPHTLRLERLGRKPWETLLAQGDRKPTLHAVMKKRLPGEVD